VPALQLRLQVGGFIGGFDFGDRGHRNIFHDEMRRDHHDTLHAMVLHAAGIDRGDRSAVGMAEQETAAETYGVEQRRQNFERFDMHIVERTRQRHRTRRAIARARIDENAAAGRGLKPIRKIAPQRGRPQTFMQHDDRGRIRRRRTDHAVFEIGRADVEGASGI
jgi:hypothetical protein